MSYRGKNELKSSNVNYVGRDFTDLKTSLMKYAKSYFPNSYKDFNETSPGMMLIELSAYVGDVLNFYVDNQYKEMLLPLAEEKRNLINLAKSYGYKVKATTPAYADLTVKQTIGTKESGDPNYDDAVTIDRGMRVISSTNSDIAFETLDVVDFKNSGSSDLEPLVTNIDESTGLPDATNGYTLTRKVKSISAESKVTTFSVTAPVKFLKLTLPGKNVVDIIKVQDSTNAIWYEVNTLSQDRVRTQTHYSVDTNRVNAYTNSDGTQINLPVPYSLEYFKTSKRFVVEVDENNNTTLMFGNGVLKNGNTFDSNFLAVEQIGINIPGGEENLEDSIDPLMGDAYGTLGESPSHTTLTVTYRVGGGISSNVAANDLITIDTANTVTLPSGQDLSSVSVVNPYPAAGGSAGETIDEIRHRAQGHIYTQNRCVTKEDFEARSLNMDAKFGNIAKVYASRSGAVRTAQREKVADLVDRLKQIIDKNYQLFDQNTPAGAKMGLLNDIKLLLDANKDGGLNPDDFGQLYEVLEMAYANITQDDRLYTVDLYLLSYDRNKNLITTPNIIKQNLKTYLNEYRMLTDQITIFDGYVVNFGVIFDIIARPEANKDDVKLKCIDAITDYFKIDGRQFKEIFYTNTIENLLWGVDGIGAVNYVTITQDFDYNAEGGKAGSKERVFKDGLYNILINSDGSTSTGNNTGYGYYYDFSRFYGIDAVAGRGVVMPAYEPSVFELKYPKQNIKGIVR